MIRICNEPYVEAQPLSHTFDFPLSDFQKYAVEGLSAGHHVLVTAHTGSGKTLPAEFAIQHFCNLGKKVIYTSPIKALSNQKYYEFSRKYPGIEFGLFTGDIKLNPCAQVLIMTTEILMNHLYSLTHQADNCIGSNAEVVESSNIGLHFNIDIESELGCVVFDEVHYINDKDRGNVWEQTILMLPSHIQMLMLSATIDDAEGFAKWCASKDGSRQKEVWIGNGSRQKEVWLGNESRQKEVWLTGTTMRVVPLTHYLYMTTTESIFKYIKDKTIQSDIRQKTNKLIPIQTPDGKINEQSIHTIKTLKNHFTTHNIFMKRKHVLNQLTQHLKDNEMLPAIAFVFSRKNVEICAKEITTNLLPFDSKVPYTIRTECEQILRKFPNYREYMELPEYEELVTLLERGIGIHHSGMIPIFKEIVELMISKKNIMLLFATESFAIGLDCPIKTAIFTSLTKYDGQAPRYLHPHEYTQMAGRAGRRGIDTVGHVIHCNNLFTPPSTTEYSNILCGKSQKLVSKFHINYNVVTNIIRQSDGSKSTIANYVNKSMSYTQFARKIEQQETVVTKARRAAQEIADNIEKNGRTPREACERWIVLDQMRPTLQNKKRKEAEREIDHIQTQHRHLMEDIGRIREMQKAQRSLWEEENYIEYLREYHIGQIEGVLSVLLACGFIECIQSENTRFSELVNGTDYYTLTRLGKMAQITEIHGLVIANVLDKTRMLSGVEIPNIIKILSLFCDIKVVDELRISSMNPIVEESGIAAYAKMLEYEFRTIEEREQMMELDTGIDYAQPLVYDLIDIIDEWILAADETACKRCIQRMGEEKGISIGDFTKAMLKIATVAKEIGGVCEKLGEMDLLHRLTKVDEVILKYMITSQSLYV